VTRAAAAHPGVAQGVAAAFGAMLIWGGQLPIAKGAFVALDGYSVTVVRYVVASAARAAAVVAEGRGAFADSESERVRCCWPAASGSAAPRCCCSWPVVHAPRVAVIILALHRRWRRSPNGIIERRPPPAFTLACIAIAFVGVALVVTRGVGLERLASAHGTELLGDALVVLAVDRLGRLRGGHPRG